MDRERDELIANQDFGEDDDAALKAYTQAEWEYLGQSRYDIVLIGSDSIETVKVTHSNYFPGVPQMVRTTGVYDCRTTATNHLNHTVYYGCRLNMRTLFCYTCKCKQERR